MEVLEIEKNEYLLNDIKAFYHGFHRSWSNTQVGYINTLKNDDGSFTNDKIDFGYTLHSAKESLYNALQEDLPLIANSTQNKLTICVMPRARCNSKYLPSQLLFLETIKKFTLSNFQLFNDGTDYIKRVIDTPTTHLTKDYESINVGITIKTCVISDNVNGKDILLIDDIYTKSVNIDEDAIQAFYDKGANSVIFYAIGKTL